MDELIKADTKDFATIAAIALAGIAYLVRMVIQDRKEKAKEKDGEEKTLRQEISELKTDVKAIREDVHSFKLQYGEKIARLDERSRKDEK